MSGPVRRERKLTLFAFIGSAVFAVLFPRLERGRLVVLTFVAFVVARKRQFDFALVLLLLFYLALFLSANAASSGPSQSPRAFFEGGRRRTGRDSLDLCSPRRFLPRLFLEFLACLFKVGQLDETVRRFLQDFLDVVRLAREAV